MSAILRRILAHLGAPELVEALAALPASDLQSLLMAVARRRAQEVAPAELLRDSRILLPSRVEARSFAAFERAAFAAAAGFEAVELSPVAPFAVDAVLGRIDPNNTLVTIRNLQAMADPTSALALECARRRRAARGPTLALVASQRVIRLQPTTFEDHTPHFRQLAMVTAGRDAGGLRFELEALRAHLGVYLTLLHDLTALGHRFAPVTVTLADTDAIRAGSAAGHARLAAVRADVLPALAARFPDVELRIDEQRKAALGYYRGLCLQLWATDRTGAVQNIGDGGFVDWTQRLLADRKERLLTSGLGTELILKRFAT